MYIYWKARSLPGAQWAEEQGKFRKREQGQEFRFNSGRHEVVDTWKGHSPDAP